MVNEPGDGLQELAPVPSAGTFLDEGADYLPAPEMEAIALRLLLDREFADVRDWSVAYLWKAEGGVKSGKARLGACQKANPLVRHLTRSEVVPRGVDFVIWFAADTARGIKLRKAGAEALVFHELKHLSTTFDREGNPKPTVIGHDAEVFAEEIKRYGLWTSSIKYVARAFQLRLGEAIEPDDIT